MNVAAVAIALLLAESPAKGEPDRWYPPDYRTQGHCLEQCRPDLSRCVSDIDRRLLSGCLRRLEACVERCEDAARDRLPWR